MSNSVKFHFLCEKISIRNEDDYSDHLNSFRKGVVCINIICCVDCTKKKIEKSEIEAILVGKLAEGLLSLYDL